MMILYIYSEYCFFFVYKYIYIYIFKRLQSPHPLFRYPIYILKVAVILSTFPLLKIAQLKDRFYITDVSDAEASKNKSTRNSKNIF